MLSSSCLLDGLDEVQMGWQGPWRFPGWHLGGLLLLHLEWGGPSWKPNETLPYSDIITCNWMSPGEHLGIHKLIPSYHKCFWACWGIPSPGWFPFESLHRKFSALELSINYRFVEIFSPLPLRGETKSPSKPQDGSRSEISCLWGWGQPLLFTHYAVINVTMWTLTWKSWEALLLMKKV